MRIVLVEDSPVVRERLIAMVSGLRDATLVGYAEDAVHATACIKALQPEVVILDIQLAQGSGIEVLREVKRLPQAPVAIMLTNLVSDECRAICRRAGAEFFLDKSFGYDQLIDILEELGLHRASSVVAPS